MRVSEGTTNLELVVWDICLHGYLVIFIRVLFEFPTFWRQGDDMLMQSGCGFTAGKKVISKRFTQPSILPRACASALIM